MPRLKWLPREPEWRQRLAALDPVSTWEALRSLANSEIDFLETLRLDRRLSNLSLRDRPEPVRLALLSSSNVEHLLPSLRVAALRRNIWLDVYVPDYGQYRRALLEGNSDLAKFQPEAILFAIDASAFIGPDYILDGKAEGHLSQCLADLVSLWRVAQEKFGAQVIQQTFLPIFPYLLGSTEHRAPGSSAAMVNAGNERLRVLATNENIDLLALDYSLQRDGIGVWHSSALWNRAKQEISPTAAPMYGELVVRILAARRGRSAKCLVLDLDNTIWGGVIGDDGLDGISLGEGSAEGEAFLQFQRYTKALSKRGVILAVCSKNDNANALEAFEKHPEMILRRSDIAAFFANWDDKATNLRRIATELNIGTDTLVFADDNQFERNLIRRELPEVHVPELPEDPSLFGATIADAGYFEAIELTREDITRNVSYQATRRLREHKVAAADMEAYLSSLNMQLVWGPFDSVSLKRVTQLINKTNQFNLTTRRYSEAEIEELLNQPDHFGMHFRLVDRYADHGIIGVLIAQRNSDGALKIETWLMSCRVLGRGVEKATLSVLVDEARRLGFKKIVGQYRPSAKNGMVRDLYPNLGFERIAGSDDGDMTCFKLDVSAVRIETSNISIREIDGGRSGDLHEADANFS